MEKRNLTVGWINFFAAALLIIIDIVYAIDVIIKRSRAGEPDEEDKRRNKIMKNLRMKAARAAMDMSQQQLADAVGVSRQTVNAIEKGDYNPTINLCIAICRALGRTLDELFWEEG